MSSSSLPAGEELVERPGRCHFHHQHQRLGLAQADHAYYVGVIQLVHDLSLTHHVVLYPLLVLALQDLNGYVDVFAEEEIKWQ